MLRLVIAVCCFGIISCSTPQKQIMITKTPDTTQKHADTLALSGDSIAIWHKLQILSLNKLNTYAARTTSSNDLAWIKLAIFILGIVKTVDGFIKYSSRLFLFIFS